MDVTALFSAISSVANLGKPVIEEAVAQKHEAALRQRMSELQDILSKPDSVDRSRALAAFVGRLCGDAGHPFVVVAGASVEVPVEAFVSLVAIAGESIKFRADLARLQFKR